ncbi:hypothetical protein HX837_08075 [Marine Group I thaumarchaeote]|uniref:Tail completion and sheath stabilizer protein n=1 Tax=Marine Group I thaumarchaeote TaxID=2511932 RepID=A0A7K4MS85_9ARCH|nr:hypothetical protein [Marine Group I thaumarchaeote]
MASLVNQPKNMNPLADVQFKFVIGALPNVTFFVQSTALPGITLAPLDIGLPQRTGLALNTGVIQYEELTIAFLVDEYLKNWMEVYNWILGNPSETSGVLTILSSSMNPTMEAHFKQLFPTSLSALEFDSTTADPTYQQASVSFKYTSYTIKSLIND